MKNEHINIDLLVDKFLFEKNFDLLPELKEKTSTSFVFTLCKTEYLKKYNKFFYCVFFLLAQFTGLK